MATLDPELQAIYDKALADGLSAEQLGALYGMSGADVTSFLSGFEVEPLATGQTAQEIHQFAVDNSLSAEDLALGYSVDVAGVSQYISDQGWSSLDEPAAATAPPPTTTTAPPPTTTTAAEGDQTLIGGGGEFEFTPTATGPTTGPEATATGFELPTYTERDYSDLGIDTSGRLPTELPGPTAEEFAATTQTAGTTDIGAITQAPTGDAPFQPQTLEAPAAPAETPVAGTSLFTRAEEAATAIPGGTALGPTVTEAPTTTGDTALTEFQGTQATETATGLAAPGETAVGPAVTETPAFTAGPAQQTGEGTVFEAPTAAEGARSFAENLAYFTSQENPLIALSEQRGLNIAEERGMGSGSFAARAAEGAVLDYAVPIVSQTEQTAAQERMQARDLTASSELAARQRQLDESMQNTQFTFQSGEAAVDRRMSRDFEDTRTRLQELMQERELAVRSGDQAKARQMERDISNDQNRLAALMQSSEQGFQAGEAAAQRQVVRDLDAQQTRLTELTQQRDLAVRSGDLASARQLEADIEAATLQVAESQQIRELASLEYRNTQNLSSSERQQAAELTVRQMMQRDQYTAEQTMQLRDLAYRQESERLTRLQSSLENQRQLAVQREDAEAQRQLQRELSNVTTALQLTTQDRDIEFQTVQREMDRRLQIQMQDVDIDYREWLQDATSGHETLLETNRNAAILLSSYQDQLGQILANPDSTRDQKQSAIDALKTAVDGSLTVLESISSADLTQYLPSTAGGGALPDLSLGYNFGASYGGGAEYL